MNFFKECAKMDMNHAGHHQACDTDFDAGFFASNAHLGYAYNARLDDIIRAVKEYPEEEVDLSEICSLLNINMSTLTKADIEYIIKELR